MTVQVAIKEVASGTETAAATEKHLMDLEQKLEAASQREASLKADISKVCTSSGALPWHGRHAAAATWLAHAEAPRKPASGQKSTEVHLLAELCTCRRSRMC